MRCIVLRLLIVLTGFLAGSAAGPGRASEARVAQMEHIVLRQDGKDVAIDGRLKVEAQDGGLLMESRDGKLWTVVPEQRVSRKTDDAPFTPFSADDLGTRMLAELPKGFDVHHTVHYVICYNTSREYAQWCGSLFERLYMAFNSYWTHKGFHLREPEFPLVAVVFNDRRSYIAHAQAEVGEAAGSIIGYFSLMTNRMTMYDLTGVEALGRSRKRGTQGEINQVLSQPDAERTVATIVHEATHQIAFNCGLHTRLSDCPHWFSEGIAIYFEAPDLSSLKGWRNVGGVNRPRLTEFRKSLAGRRADSLLTLISDDRRFQDPQQSFAAYAEAWALTYFLIRQHPKQYIDYLKMLSQKKQLIWDDAAQRRREFSNAFGDLRKLDVEFVRYMAKVQ